MLISIFLSWFLVGLFVRISKQRGWGQRVRRDGPQTHLSKEGTPTAGGVGFVVALLLVWVLLYARDPDPKEVVVVLAALAMGVIGLIDDVLKIRSRMFGGKSELMAREKFPLQILVGAVFGYFAWRLAPALPPGLGPWFDIPLYTIVMAGAVNAFNFTDGLDGLLSGVAIIVLLPLIALQASPLAALMVGALLGFLWFNAHPAKVFMGDMGSHAIGALTAGAYVLNDAGNLTWLLPLVAVIPVTALLSVVIQVVYFRRTGGKRFFRMTPIQHHFELSGWPETQVTLRFWLVTAVTTTLAWYLLGARP
ncbi:phospho-N-acetylmuramoyl-pentapeptide-transferase [Deinococcus peraridilitoris]|uniref:Phospho-N-acetylmuramoyl-pentapeptide-transferase n=1 Tax=Deinococcus peraridilitoris (strain DSM 19664 / LMG 22246 / CIP 109416 / KR-200) TaxID=937777 RepID=K9ZXZ6_DEIPD|nr:phospho-N-acetylmuramoyl-pentapeptide-transferase [Deinococcus peraridilitoris]AFZ65797.1 UDP-N-acetylmuramyl pentapeptide phosphotransferase/UDP-N-acetylglucosamine-1-phosphate transferase [Deinococcus peraridilitoris DSM 19664]